MSINLKRARAALERQGRYAPGRGPEPEDIVEAIREVINHLEKLEKLSEVEEPQN